MPSWYNFRQGITYTVKGYLGKKGGIETYFVVNKRYSRQMLIHLPSNGKRRYNVKRIKEEDIEFAPQPAKGTATVITDTLPWMGERWKQEEEITWGEDNNDE